MAATPPLPPPLAAVGMGSTSSSTNHRLALNSNRQYQAMKKERERRLAASKTLSISRRDVLRLTGQSLVAVTFWSMEPKPAVSRTLDRAEIRRKFAEKIKQLKEKAGLANPNDNTDEDDEIPKSSFDKDKEAPSRLDLPNKLLPESIFP